MVECPPTLRRRNLGVNNELSDAHASRCSILSMHNCPLNVPDTLRWRESSFANAIFKQRWNVHNAIPQAAARRRLASTDGPHAREWRRPRAEGQPCHSSCPSVAFLDCYVSRAGRRIARLQERDTNHTADSEAHAMTHCARDSMLNVLETAS